MEVIRVTQKQYAQIVKDRRVFFNEPTFCELNKYKVDDVQYLLIMKGNSPRFGLIIGVDGKEAKCPFSAPYSYPVEVRRNATMKSFDAAVVAIDEYCIRNSFQNINFIFPPLFYDEHLLSAWINAFYLNGYKIANIDINHALMLDQGYQQDYNKQMNHHARNSLKRAIDAGLDLQRCESKADIARAYEIIQINHLYKGYPVKMSFEEIMNTLKLVPHDVFVVVQGGKCIVAEILYHVNKRIVQGIYCGYLPEYEKLGGMNFLTYQTLEYYGATGFAVIDKAISSEDSIPNNGLCDFKESVGCKRNLKYTFYKTYANIESG